MLNITNRKRNENQNHSQNDYYQKDKKYQVLERTWRKENINTLMVGL